MPRDQSGSSWQVLGRVGTSAQPLQGENYSYSCVLGHVQLLIRLHFHIVVLPDFYLHLVYFPAWIEAEVQEREFSHRLGGFYFLLEKIVDRESGCRNGPRQGDLDDILARCLHRKPQPIHWLLFIPLHPLKSLHTDGDMNLSRPWG